MSASTFPQINAADSSSGRSPRGLFELTPWTDVLNAGDAGNPSQRNALEKLCKVYWSPLYAYISRKISDPHLAQDLTQSFFCRLLSGGSLRFADPARGRFRTFLLQAFEWHLANEFREGRAVKRGGKVTIFSMDFVRDSVLGNHDAGLTPEQLFEREWALSLLRVTMERLRAEHSDGHSSQRFDLLKSIMMGQEMTSGYSAVCHKLEMTEAAARMAVSRLRSRYREILREEILKTVASSQDVDDEIRHLFQALSQR